MALLSPTTPLLRPLTFPTALFHAPCSRTYVVVSLFPSALTPNHLADRPTTHPPIYHRARLGSAHPPFSSLSFPFLSPTLIFPSICTPRYYQLLLPRASSKPPRGTSRRRLPEEFSAKNENSNHHHLRLPLAPATAPSLGFTSTIHPPSGPPPIECRLAAGLAHVSRYCTLRSHRSTRSR